MGWVEEPAIALRLGVSAGVAAHTSSSAGTAEKDALQEMESLRQGELKAARALTKQIEKQIRSSKKVKQQMPEDAQWSWEDGSSGSGQWQPFDFETRDILTAAFIMRAKRPTLKLTHGYFGSAGGYVINFKVSFILCTVTLSPNPVHNLTPSPNIFDCTVLNDFKAMTQKKVASGYERNIKAIFDGVTMSSESSAADILAGKLAEAKANVKRFKSRGAATLRHGWEWQHSDGSWRSFEPHISRALFDERAAGNAVVKIDLRVEDGVQHIFPDAPHLVIDPRAEQTELFVGLQGNFRGKLMSSGKLKGRQIGKLGNKRKDFLRSSNAFDFSQHAIVDQGLGVHTTPILSFSGHFVFGSNDDFLTIKLGTTGEQKGVRWNGFSGGAAFVIGCMGGGNSCRKSRSFDQHLVTGNTRSSPSFKLTHGKILKNEKFTFEVLWDGHSGSIHLWKGFAELAPRAIPYGDRPATRGKGFATYLGHSPVAPNAGAPTLNADHICLFNRESASSTMEVSQVRLAVYRDPTMAVEAARTAAAEALAASKQAAVPPPTGAVIIDMSASPMVMRDPSSSDLSPLRAFYLGEPVEESLAPTEFRMTIENPSTSELRRTSTCYTLWPGSPSVTKMGGRVVRFCSNGGVPTFSTIAFPQHASKVDPVYYEVKLISNWVHLQVGFATSALVCGSNRGVGDDAASWGFDGDRQRLYHTNLKSGAAYSSFGVTKWKQGDVIGFLYTPAMGTIEVSTNGVKHRGAAVAQNVPKGCFPAISLKGGDLAYNFHGRGLTPFAFAPAGFGEDLFFKPLENLPIGTAVARGPEWKWGDQDGTKGSVGHTTSAVDGRGWVTVQWSNAETHRYRVGAELPPGGNYNPPQFDLVPVVRSGAAHTSAGGRASVTAPVVDGAAWWLTSAEEQTNRLASRVEPDLEGRAPGRAVYAAGSNEGREAALEYVGVAEHILRQERVHRLGAAGEDAASSAPSSADDAVSEARFVHLLTGERTSASALEARGIPASAVIDGIQTFTSLMEHCGLGLYRDCGVKSNGRPVYLNVNGRYMAYYSKAGEWTIAQRKLVSEALEAGSEKGGIDTLTGSGGDREQEPGPPIFRVATNSAKHPLPGFSFIHECGWAPASGVKSNHPEASKAEILQAIINRDSQGGEAERWAQRAHDAAASDDHAVPDWADEASTCCDAIWEWNKGADGKLIVKGETNDTSRWRRFDAVSAEILTNAYVRRLKKISLPHLRYPISVNLEAMHSVREDTGWITPVRGFVAGFPAVGGVEEARRPKLWFPQRARTVVVDVDAASAEWTEVTSRFCAHADDLAPGKSGTMELPEARVMFHSILRIQNAPLYDVFEMKRRQIAERNGVDNERTLFHATGDVVPAGIYASRHGFDPRKNASSTSARYPMSLDSDLGQAAYFSTSAAAIQELAHRTTVGTRSAMQVFMCRVVCGKSTAVQGKMGQKYPDDGAGNGRSFDSHTGYPQNPCGGARGFAIFDAMQAYPEYLVTFNAPEPLDLTGDVIESAVFHSMQDWTEAFALASTTGKVPRTSALKTEGRTLSGKQIPQNVRWSSSERGKSIVLERSQRVATRSGSVRWGTQATELLPPTSFRLGLTVLNTSNYLVIGVGPKNWKWASSTVSNKKQAGCHWFTSDGASSLPTRRGGRSVQRNASKAIKDGKKCKLTLIFDREVAGAHSMTVTRTVSASRLLYR